MTAHGAAASTVVRTFNEVIAEIDRAGGAVPERRAQLAASEAAISSAGRWADPVIGWATFLDPIETRLGAQRHRLSLTQRVPLSGRPGRRADVEVARRTGYEVAIDQARMDAIRSAAHAWARLREVQAVTSAVREQVDLTETQRALEGARVERGGGRLRALAELEIRAARLDELLARLADQQTSAQAALNAAMGRPSDAAVADSLPPAVETLVDTAVVDAPMLRELDAKIAVAEAGARLADRSPWPDLMVGADLIVTDPRDDADPPGNGSDALIARVAIDLPLWRGRDRAAHDAALGMAAAAREKRAATERALRAALVEIDARWRQADRRVRMLDDTVLPLRDTVIDLVLAEVEGGDGALTDLLRAHDDALDAQRERAEAVAERERAAADHAWRLGRIPGGAR